jgi:hypothetical protein
MRMTKVCALVGAAFLLMLGTVSQVRAAQVQLAWEPPTTDEEGTVPPNLVGYRLYYGLYDGEALGEFHAVIDIGNQPSYTVTDLTPGETYIFAVTAYDNAGNETDFSNITTYSVPLPGEEGNPPPEDGEPDLTTPPADMPSAMDDSAPLRSRAEAPQDQESAGDYPDEAESDEASALSGVDEDQWRNYRVSLTLGSANANDIGVMFRYHDADNYYRFSWNNQHRQRSLVKRRHGVFTLLAEDTVSAAPQHHYHLTIVALDETLEVWIDATLVFSVRDVDLDRGPIALYALGNGDNSFDNVVVEDLTSQSILLWNDFDDGRFADWVIVDEGVMTAASEWAGREGALVQRAYFETDITDPAGAAILGTYALYMPSTTSMP